MKRRPRAHTERRRMIRRHRLRQHIAMDPVTSAEPGWVSANVLFTDTSRAGETAAWLEPDRRGDPTSTCTVIQY